MKISNNENYNALTIGIEKKGWCYSLDGQKIKTAVTVWEKMCYIGRSLIFSNGNSQKLQSAIISSFSKLDSSLIKSELNTAKQIKAYEKIAKYADPEGEQKPNTNFEALLEGVPDNKLLGDSEGSEIGANELLQLTKIHKVFRNIHGLAKKIEQDKDAVSAQIENRKDTAIRKELTLLIDSNFHYIATEFQKKFMEKELPNTLLVEAKKYVKSKRHLADNLEGKSSDQAVRWLLRLLTRINNSSTNIANHETSDSPLVEFKKLFAEHSQSTKKSLMKKVLAELIPLSKYAEPKGREYGQAMVMNLMSAFGNMTPNDIGLFQEVITSHLQSCELCYHFANYNKNPG